MTIWMNSRQARATLLALVLAACSEPVTNVPPIHGGTKTSAPPTPLFTGRTRIVDVVPGPELEVTAIVTNTTQESVIVLEASGCVPSVFFVPLDAEVTADESMRCPWSSAGRGMVPGDSIVLQTTVSALTLSALQPGRYAVHAMVTTKRVAVAFRVGVVELPLRSP